MNEVIEAGIDYLAMTMPLDTEEGPKWSTTAQSVIDLLIAHGNIPRVGTFRGYDGVWAGGAFYGSREDGQYVHVAGSFASRVFGQLYHPSAHYSRFDLQATVKLEERDNDLANRCYSSAEAFNLSAVLRKRRKIHLHTSNDGGATLYIGSRKSEHFCRLYNKEAQSGDEFYDRCWRYEVELHNDSATAAATYVWQGSRGQSKIAASTVWHYFKERGVQPPWTREGEENAILPRSAPRSDIDRKLAWLREQVGPTVELLMQELPANIVLEALRLGNAAEPFPIEGRDQPTGGNRG